MVIAKYAMSLDGRIATVAGHSRWITGETARAHLHRLRATVDAILVGVGTVVADDPLLTARTPSEEPPPHQPLRVILDSAGRLPPTARLLDPALPGQTVVAMTERMPADRRAALREPRRRPADPAGRPGRRQPAGAARRARRSGHHLAAGRGRRARSRRLLRRRPRPQGPGLRRPGDHRRRRRRPARSAASAP